MATPVNVIEGAFVLVGSGIASHTGQQIQDTEDALATWFRHTIGSIDPFKAMPEPDLCSFGFEDTPKGEKQRFLKRFMWFQLPGLTFEGKTYGLGMNLHSSNTIGGMWLLGAGFNVVRTPELHPFKSPTIPNKGAWTAFLRNLVKNGVLEKKKKKKK